MLIYDEVPMAGPVAIPAGETVAYTANRAGLARATVQQILVVNISGSAAVQVGVSIVRGGGAGGSTNRIVPDVMSLGPGEILALDLGQVLSPGDAISWKASVAGRAVGTISGVEKVNV